MARLVIYKIIIIVIIFVIIFLPGTAWLPLGGGRTLLYNTGVWERGVAGRGVWAAGGTVEHYYLSSLCSGMLAAARAAR